MKVEVHIYKSDLDALKEVLSMVDGGYAGTMNLDQQQAVDKTARLLDILTYVYKVARDPSLAEQHEERPSFEELAQQYLQE